MAEQHASAKLCAGCCRVAPLTAAVDSIAADEQYEPFWATALCSLTRCCNDLQGAAMQDVDIFAITKLLKLVASRYVYRLSRGVVASRIPAEEEAAKGAAEPNAEEPTPGQ